MLTSKNYSGFQAVIPNSILNKLKVGESYNLSLDVIKNNKVYEIPINNTEGFILNSRINYNGFQVIIAPKQLVEASTSNKLYIRVTIDGKTYERLLTGNVDTREV